MRGRWTVNSARSAREPNPLLLRSSLTGDTSKSFIVVVRFLLFLVNLGITRNVLACAVIATFWSSRPPATLPLYFPPFCSVFGIGRCSAANASPSPAPPRPAPVVGVGEVPSAPPPSE